MKKNKRVIILLSVLILGIGLSLAYFVGKTIFSGTGATTEGRTATVNGSTLDVKGTLEFDDPDIYPGHKKVSKIEVTATGDNEFIAYNLIWEGNNGLNTNLKYTVYKTSSDIKVNATCEKKKKVRNGIQYLNEECNITNIDQLGEIISEGEITKTEGETPTKEIITNNQYITSKEEPGEKEYYYVIIEYPNLTEETNKEQNEDIGQNFNGKVYAEISNKSADINILGIYIKDEDTGEYKEATQMPDNTYVVNSDMSRCSNDAKVMTDVTDNTVKIKGLTLDGTSCYLYYEKVKGKDLILVENTIKGSIDVVTGPSCSDNSQCGDTKNMNQNGIYSVEDDYGISYVFRGTVDNNWVKFGKEGDKDIWWRIIRINGNGTIRLIYAGTGTNAPQKTGNVTMIEPYKGDNYSVPGSSYPRALYYNQWYNDNKYVGYMYGTQKSGSADSESDEGTTTSTTKGDKPAHENNYDSDAKKQIDYWYQNKTNLISLNAKIDVNTGFCNDRTISPLVHGSFGTLGYGKKSTAYGGYHRTQDAGTNWDKTEQEPTLKCGYNIISKTTDEEARKRDLFTGPNSIATQNSKGQEIEGNNKLTYPVGMITMDEVIYAGGFGAQYNNGYWLYTGEYYWTMSPYSFGSNGYALVFVVYNSGSLYANNVNYDGHGIRPVINLKSNTTFTTTKEENKGTSSNPYIVE